MQFAVKYAPFLRVVSAAVAAAAPQLATLLPQYAWLFSALALVAGGTALTKKPA